MRTHTKDLQSHVIHSCDNCIDQIKPIKVEVGDSVIGTSGKNIDAKVPKKKTNVKKRYKSVEEKIEFVSIQCGICDMILASKADFVHHSISHMAPST